jgi:chromatin remodeling complex protein RSC6
MITQNIMERLNGFQMTKYLEKHMEPKPVTEDELKERARAKSEREERDRARKAAKKPPNPNSVFMRPVSLSEQLQSVLGEQEVGFAGYGSMLIFKRHVGINHDL